MNTDRDIDRAIAAGEKNKKTVELVHNWCAHARIQKMGGVGLVEQMTGLPIGHHAMVCDYAPAGGIAAWDLAEGALDFYDRNCVGCKKRQAVRLPNLSELVDARDRSRARRADRDRQHAQDKAEALARRRRARDALRPGRVAAGLALLDDIEEADATPSDDARKRILETARLAPELFDSKIIEYFFVTLENDEYWFAEIGLRVLSQLGADSSRLVRCALTNLARHYAVDVAAAVVQENVDRAESQLVLDAVPVLIELARPVPFPLGIDARVPQSEPLLAIARHWPSEVRTAIANLLSSKRLYSVRLGAGSLEALVDLDRRLPLEFVRPLAAILARPHLVLDADDTSMEVREMCADLQSALMLAFAADPDAVDTKLLEYYESASTDGEAQLIGTYEHLFRNAHRQETPHPPDAFRTALRRLIWAATTSKNDEVLRVIQQALHGEPEPLVAVARSEIDVLLGAAAVMDDRATQSDVDSKTPTTGLEVLQRNNFKSLLYQLRDEFARWAAFGAKEDKQATEKYVDFLTRVTADQANLSSTLVEHAHVLMERTSGLNSMLPAFYSALVGTSNLGRASAATALAKLSRKRVADLPNLVFDAFVLLLTDPYVIVHQAAVRSLERLAIPPSYDRVVSAALTNLIVVYARDKDRRAFLLECIELFVNRVDDRKTPAMDSTLLALVQTVAPEIAIRHFRYFGWRLAQVPGYVETVLRFVRDDCFQLYRDDVLRLLNYAPPTAIALDRQNVVATAVERSDNAFVAGSFIEVLTKAGSWQEAEQVAQASVASISDTVRMQQVRWDAQLTLIAVSFEAAIAAGKIETIEALGTEWARIAALIEKDRTENAGKRNPFTGFLS